MPVSIVLYDDLDSDNWNDFAMNGEELKFMKIVCVLKIVVKFLH